MVSSCLFYFFVTMSLFCLSFFLCEEWRINPGFKSTVKGVVTSPQIVAAITLDVYLGVHYANPIAFLNLLVMIVVGYRVSWVLKPVSIREGVLHRRQDFMPELPAPFPSACIVGTRMDRVV